MSAQWMSQFIGRQGCWKANKLEFIVTIVDARERFGTTDVLITPEAGSGQRWVELTSVVMDG
jgi:hypothetical protein